jgi:hypothetical protein
MKTKLVALSILGVVGVVTTGGIIATSGVFAKEAVAPVVISSAEIPVVQVQAPASDFADFNAIPVLIMKDSKTGEIVELGEKDAQLYEFGKAYTFDAQGVGHETTGAASIISKAEAQQIMFDGFGGMAGIKDAFAGVKASDINVLNK